MFRHKPAATIGAVEKPSADASVASAKDDKVTGLTQTDPRPENDLRALLEKNLKWSQIIYEQNRRINRRLTWSAAASWFRLVIILVPLALALWYLPPVINNAWSSYQNILNGGLSTSASGADSSFTLEQLTRLLPLNAAQREQLKTLLK